MRGLCDSCGALLFQKYGDGERECAACRERREEQADVIARDRAVYFGYQLTPKRDTPPKGGRNGKKDAWR